SGQKSVDGNRIASGIVVLQFRHTPRGRHANDIKALLDRHRHAVQRPPILAARQRFVRRTCAFPRFGKIHRDDRVEGGVVSLDTLQEQLEKLACADGFTLDLSSESSGRAKRQVEHLISPNLVYAPSSEAKEVGASLGIRLTTEIRPKEHRTRERKSAAHVAGTPKFTAHGRVNTMAKQSTSQKKTIGRVMHEYKRGQLKSGGGRRQVKSPK